MATNSRSNAVEILPAVVSYAVGSTKNTTFRVTKSGSNMAVPKVKQPNKKGVNGDYLKSGAAKWRTMSKEQKAFWQDIAEKEDFWSKWQAFMSSFLTLAGIHGLDYVMNNDVSYIYSESRFEKEKHLLESVKRNQNYHVDPAHYAQTEETLTLYPVAMDSPVVFVKLLDVIDVNNALLCKLVYRCDPVVEYEYHPLETGAVEKGYYIRSERPRQGDELYELFKPV